MYISELIIQNFKSIEKIQFSPHPLINIICGKNGTGKTTILDAIHYISLTKSFIQPIDNENINKKALWFSIIAQVKNHEKIEEYQCIVTKDDRKRFKYFSKEYQRLSDHIGRVPTIVISPLDQLLITEGSEQRRKLIDATLSQYDKSYMSYLIEYNKLLKQRNALLKNAPNRANVIDIIKVIDYKMTQPANYIYFKRKELLANLSEKFNQIYSHIAPHEAQKIHLTYYSQLHDASFEQLLSNNYYHDISSETTGIGIHKDDIKLLIDGKNIRYFASQGQQKSALLSLKLSILQHYHELQLKPVILIDDIFDKLDNTRVHNLLEMILTMGNQIFMTHTNKDDFKQFFSLIPSDNVIYELKNGNLLCDV